MESGIRPSENRGHPYRSEGGAPNEGVYNDPQDQFWAMYLAVADKNDDVLVERLKGDADGVLIFTGLFAALVGAFIIEAYKLLGRDSGDDTIMLLSGISGQISSISNDTISSPASIGSFHAPPPAFRINALWFISLFLSLSVALAATLMQQWSRRYLHAARRRGPPHKRGPVHLYLYQGVKTFQMERVGEVMVGILHTSVLLFLAGLIQFLFIISPEVAHIFLPFFCVGTSVYLGLSILPAFFPGSPYDTPLSPIFR